MLGGEGEQAQRRDRWVWVSVIPLGLGSWAPIIAGSRCRVWWWTALGVVWPVITAIGFVLSGRKGGHDNVAGALVWCGWAGAVITSFAIRPAYDRRTGYPLVPLAWPRPTDRSRTWTPRYGVAAFFLVFIGDGALALLLDHVVHIHVIVGVAVLITDATLLLALVPLGLQRGASASDLGIRPTVALPSLGLVILALFVYLAVAAAWTVAFISKSTRKSADILSQAHHLGPAGTVVTVIAVGISAPVVEEIFFRGVLYRSLRNRMPVVPAAIIAGALFGFAHITGYPLITLPIKAVFGVLACLLYERTGSLLPGMALHAFVDATAVDVALTGNAYIVLCVAAVAILVLLTRAGVQRLRGSQPRAAHANL